MPDPTRPVRITEVLTNVPGMTVHYHAGTIVQPGDRLQVVVTSANPPEARLVHTRRRWWALGRYLPVRPPRRVRRLAGHIDVLNDRLRSIGGDR